MTEAVRQIYWNIGEILGSLTVYLTALAAMLVLFYGILRDIATWRKGRPESRLDALGSRASEYLVQSLGPKKDDARSASRHDACLDFFWLPRFVYRY